MNITFPTHLQKQVEQAIIQQALSPGQVLTPPELADRFQSTLELMQVVLQAEVRKGLVRRRGEAFEILGLAGKSLDSLFQHTSRAGMKPTSEVRAAVIEPATQEAAAKLEIPTEAPVYRLERTRIINGEVLANQVNFIPYEVSPGLENDDLSAYSFQKLLEERYYTVITDIQEEMRIASGSGRDLEILGLPPGSRVLVVERLSYSRTHSPVVWAVLHIRTDRYHYVAQLWPNAAGLLQEQGLNI